MHCFLAPALAHLTPEDSSLEGHYGHHDGDSNEEPNRNCGLRFCDYVEATNAEPDVKEGRDDDVETGIGGRSDSTGRDEERKGGKALEAEGRRKQTRSVMDNTSIHG